MSLNLYIRTTLSTATIIIIIMTRERNDNNGNNGNNSNNIVRMITRWEERNGRHVDYEISPFIPLCVFDSWLSKKIDLITVTMLIIMIMTMTRIMITSKINRNHRPTIAILFFFFFPLIYYYSHYTVVWLKYVPFLTISFIPSVHETDE